MRRGSHGQVVDAGIADFYARKRRGSAGGRAQLVYGLKVLLAVLISMFMSFSWVYPLMHDSDVSFRGI